MTAPWLKDIADRACQMRRLKHNTYIKARVGWHGLSSDEHQDTGPFLVTGTDFDNGSVNWTTCTHVSDQRWYQDPYIQLIEGDLLVTKDGTIGKLALVDGLQGRATLNSGVFVLRPTGDEYLTRYLYWVLSSKLFTEFIEFISHGSTINHLYQRQINEFYLPVWSLHTQKTIADFLDRKTAAIDALIEKKQKLLDLLAEKRAALINQAVTKGLDPNVTMKDSGIAWLGEIPAHWGLVSLRRVARVAQGDAFSHERQGRSEGELPWFKVADMNLQGNEVEMLAANNYVSKEVAAEARAAIMPEGSVIFPRVGGALLTNKRRVLVRASLIDDNTYAAIPVAGILSGFLYLSLLLVDMGRLCSAGLVPTVTFSAVKELPLTLPPLAEQERIVAHVNDAVSQLDSLVTKSLLSVERLREYRQALITAAVTGQLDITEEAA